MSVLSLSIIFVRSSSILRKIQRHVITIFQVKCQLFLSDLRNFRKNTQISNFMKILLMVAELFNVEGQAERRTDMKKLIVVFRNFAWAPKMLQH